MKHIFRAILVPTVAAACIGTGIVFIAAGLRSTQDGWVSSKPPLIFGSGAAFEVVGPPGIYQCVSGEGCFLLKPDVQP